MYLQISYSELGSIIREKTGQGVEIGYVNPQTIEIRKEIKVFIVQKTISVNVEVVQVAETDLVIKYNTGLGLEMAAKGVLIYFKETLGSLVEEQGPNTLLVHLDQIEKLKKLLSIVNLQTISFDERGANISFNAALVEFEVK